MSLKLHRAIGYGMSWGRFQELSTLPLCGDDDDELWEVLLNKFHGFKTEDLALTKEERKEFGGGQHRPAIMVENLLQLGISIGRNGPPLEYGHGSDLFVFVQNPDYTTDVVFFPNLLWGKSWYRKQDYLDLVFEAFGRDSGDGSPRAFTNYQRYGFYPYSQYVMTKDGQPVEDHYIIDGPLKEEHAEIGAIPGEIRWLMTKHGILTNEGVNELRPVIAQWWA